MNDERSKERWCQYFLQRDTDVTLIGVTQVPLGMDVDDAFPLFYEENFDEEARDALVESIHDGGVLIAESTFEPRRLLAYRLDNPNYWYGREKTLKYFGVTDFRPAC